MELLAKLGVDWRLLVAQLINFGILLAVLYKFLYKPVLKLLHERSAKIEDGLKNAEAVEVKLKEAAALFEAKTREARAEAAKLFDAAKKDVDGLRVELVAKAQKESDQIVEAGRVRLAVEKEKMMHDAQAELGDLVAQATKHELGQVMTPEMNKKLIDEAVQKVRVGRA